MHLSETTPCPEKNIPDIFDCKDIFDCNLQKNYQILIIFDTNISDATGDQMTVQFSTTPIVCFCTTWGNKTNKILHFILFRLLGFSQVVQKQTFGEVRTRMIIWCQVMSEMFAPKIIKICHFFFKSQLIMLGMLFDAFLFISTHILLVKFSPGSAKADTGEVKYWTVTWWPIVQEIIVQKIINIGYPFFKWQSIMFGMFFFPDTMYILPKAQLPMALENQESNRRLPDK